MMVLRLIFIGIALLGMYVGKSTLKEALGMVRSIPVEPGPLFPSGKTAGAGGCAIHSPAASRPLFPSGKTAGAGGVARLSAAAGRTDSTGQALLAPIAINTVTPAARYATSAHRITHRRVSAHGAAGHLDGRTDRLGLGHRRVSACGAARHGANRFTHVS
ncbi:MAG: hypothetical protein LBR77_03015 [Lachnospiraceae bacterium]|nr:hypothetical protein [Lachnospiraceae bacterium]